jgi:hypothetical protein
LNDLRLTLASKNLSEEAVITAVVALLAHTTTTPTIYPVLDPTVFMNPMAV